MNKTTVFSPFFNPKYTANFLLKFPLAHLIKLYYSNIVDSSNTGTVERAIFDQTYKQFLKRMDTFRNSRDITTWAHLKNFPNLLPPFLDTLNRIAESQSFERDADDIPQFKDVAGKVQFKRSKIEVDILESNISNENHHKIRILYTTEQYLLLSNIDDFLIMSQAVNATKYLEGTEVDTFCLRLTDNISISSYKLLI